MRWPERKWKSYYILHKNISNLLSRFIINYCNYTNIEYFCFTCRRHSLWWTRTAPTGMFSSVQQSELPLLPSPPLLRFCVCLTAWTGFLLLQCYLCTTGLYRKGGHTTKGTNILVQYIHIFHLYDDIFLHQYFQAYWSISIMVLFLIFLIFFIFSNVYFFFLMGL